MCIHTRYASPPPPIKYNELQHVTTGWWQCHTYDSGFSFRARNKDGPFVN